MAAGQAFVFSALLLLVSIVAAVDYVVVDTGETKFYGDAAEIAEPTASSADFYGQDAQHKGPQPNYRDNGDETVSDLNTGLMWSKAAVSTKISYDDAVSGAATFTLAGHTDWRLPSIKELYSLIIFSGVDPSGWDGTDTSLLTPFINTTVFTFKFGDTAAGERIIDAQYVSSTKYVSTTMGGDETVFGVNFADGRIKGYPMIFKPTGAAKTFYVAYVRGNTNYGINSFTSNADETITDSATGLIWTKADSGTAMKWKEALAWVSAKNAANHLGFSDWRLPNIKELQSIVDYTRSPDTTSSAAISPVFTITSITNAGGAADYPYFWSGTTHANMIAGQMASYVSFGRALGWFAGPGSTTKTLLDVHGAGSQRSDPKTGDAATEYPEGHGPQGDVIRIANFVRMVRDAPATTLAPGTTTLAPPPATTTTAPPVTTTLPPGVTPVPSSASAIGVNLLSVIVAAVLVLALAL